MDSLQFQTAEFSDEAPKCPACRAPLDGEYYQFSNSVPVQGSLRGKLGLGSAPSAPAPVLHDICPNCADRVRAMKAPPSHAAVVRGTLYGAGMALLCAIGYSAIILAINAEFALVSILVGYLVGTAVRKGSNGLGGRRCQIAAVALTYLAITFSYIPIAIKQYVDAQQPKTTQIQPVQAASGWSQSYQELDTGTIIKGSVFLIGLALVSPLYNLQSGLGGLLGLVIIFFGLQRAWKLTARDPRPLLGPFSRPTAS